MLVGREGEGGEGKEKTGEKKKYKGNVRPTPPGTISLF